MPQVVARANISRKTLSPKPMAVAMPFNPNAMQQPQMGPNNAALMASQYHALQSHQMQNRHYPQAAHQMYMQHPGVQVCFKFIDRCLLVLWCLSVLMCSDNNLVRLIACGRSLVHRPLLGRTQGCLLLPP